jgi:hypothetical protein
MSARDELAYARARLNRVSDDLKDANETISQLEKDAKSWSDLVSYCQMHGCDLDHGYRKLNPSPDYKSLYEALRVSWRVMRDDLYKLAPERFAQANVAVAIEHGIDPLKENPT